VDRVLGGGLVPGSVLLFAGEPGIGKSTLLLDVAARTAGAGRTALYVSAEESAAQVRGRAARTGALHHSLLLLAETDLAAIIDCVEDVRPDLLVVDSVQTVGSAEVEGAAGGPAQVRAVAAALIAAARSRGIATVLVGHVTKDGAVAGPRLLEHLVDVVVHFEGSRQSSLRLLRGLKNRFGSAEEVGCFALGDDGIVGLPDPSGLFLSRHPEPVAGTCVTTSIEGRRALLTEVQALVAPGAQGSPRRTTSGLDGSRVALVLAILERRADLRLGSADVYAATVGGMRLADPAADLALALAVASSSLDRPLPRDLLAVGELGLAGEVRPVPSVGRRLAEAARLGFRQALVPPESGTPPRGIRVVEMPGLRAALAGLDERRWHPQ
jgi:DNA repair protein RadA/Sms